MRVDQFTDYRYYSADQLPRLHRIIALKELGFTLEQIKPMLAENVSTFIRENGWRERGKHHEIYLNDPRKTAPEKLKTVLRQPFGQ